MRFIYDDMFKPDYFGVADLCLVTGNAYINNSNELVMGRGAARQLKERFPVINKEFGTQLKFIFPEYKYEALYGVMISYICRNKNTKLGVFQVKYHFKDKAGLYIIKVSTHILSLLATKYKSIIMNYPGIGYGGLTEKEVYPIIKNLPDNVFIFKKD